MQIVPQYIDIEDKIVGPLTWKHLGWLFGGGVILTIAFLMLDVTTFFLVAIPIALLVVALAFYKPSGVPLITFLGYGFIYLFRPRTYTWQRETVKKEKKKKAGVKISTTSRKKELTSDDITAIAQTLDTRGKERSKRVKELIRRSQNNQNKK